MATSTNVVVPFESSEFVTVSNSNVVFPVGVLKKIPRTALSIKDKVIIIEMVEQKRLKLTEIAERFGLAKSTLSTLIKNKEKILNAYRTMKDPSRKRVRAAAYPDLEKMLFNWISDVNATGKIVSPQLLKVKAEGFARRLGISSFRTSAGWLHNFKKRNGLKFPKATTKCVGPEFSNIISNDAIVNYHQQINHDSDGAGSERSSDSESAIHPVQLLQYERPKRLKRSLCESNPDFIFYDNGVSQNRPSDQMIVPYVHTSDRTEWSDPPNDELPLETQVKIEEPDDEEENDSEFIEPCLSLTSPDENPVVSPVPCELPVPNVRDAQQPFPTSVPPAPPCTPDPVTSRDPAKLNDSTIRVSTQQSCAENEVGTISKNPELETVFKHPLCSTDKGHTCESMKRLAESLERQAKAQEELLMLKKQRLSSEEKHRKEEIDLLKKKLAIEEKKVSVLEQLLAAYMQHPNKT